MEKSKKKLSLPAKIFIGMLAGILVGLLFLNNPDFTTEYLKQEIEANIKDGKPQFDRVIAIGPDIMMKFLAEVTRPYGIKTIISLDPIMVDGTGMCGGCRVIVGGETKFACVDGPDFDAHEVDFDSLIKRAAFYKEEQDEAAKHICNMTGGKRNG